MADEAALKEIFQRFDKDGSGGINPTELVAAMKECAPGHDDNTYKAFAADFIHKGDADGDYRLTFDEFKTAIEKVLANK